MRALFSILLFYIAAVQVTAQGVSEVGPFAGVSYYLGDLNLNKHFFFSKPAGGIVHRYILNSHYAIKNSFLYGTLEAYDSKSNNAVQVNRNLHFRSSIIDIATEIEFNFLPFDGPVGDRAKAGSDQYYFSPYVFIGISLFSFNPQANYNGTWFDLQPLGTEGQGTIAYQDRKKYSLSTISVPIGAGIKYDINNKMNFAFEWGIRMTNTDYIDDVSTTYANPVAISAEKGIIAGHLSDQSLDLDGKSSNIGRQRGNSKNNDFYAFAGVMLTFKLATQYTKQRCYGVNN
ncbi:MAG: hypothetical protein JKY52_02250 [Flavobacteriales bacterium]|nr:hypothetical protein [Flavobacteriales bacterium]